MISRTSKLILRASAIPIIAMAVLVIAVLVSVRVVAQQLDLATIRGTATDSTGATVSGATIVLADTVGVQRSSVTSSDGSYEISNLNNGTYTLTATAKGFKTFVAEDITLSA